MACLLSNIISGFDIAVINGINKPILINSDNDPRKIKKIKE